MKIKLSRKIKVKFLSNYKNLVKFFETQLLANRTIDLQIERQSSVKPDKFQKEAAEIAGNRTAFPEKVLFKLEKLNLAALFCN